MKKSVISSALKVISGAMVIAFAAILPLFPLSCKLSDDDSTESESVDSENAKNESTTSKSNLEIIQFCLIQPNLIEIEASKQVSFSEVKFKISDSNDFYEINEESIHFVQETLKATIKLPIDTNDSVNYTFSAKVSDFENNSLKFEKKFEGFNKNPARLILSEIRTERGTNNPEFIELYALKGGSISGIEIETASAGENKKITLKPCIVRAGEYITVHTAIANGAEEKSISELEEELNLSRANDSCDEGRDIWYSDYDKFVAKSDVVVLRSGVNIWDCVFLADNSSKSDWTKKMKSFAEKILEQSNGIWTSGIEFSEVISTSNTTMTRTIARQNIKDISDKYLGSDTIPNVIEVSASDWFVVADKNATPGKENSSKKYESK